MQIALLYYIYHLVCLKQINIFYKDFSIKINFQIPPSCSFYFYFLYIFNFYNPSRRYQSIDVICLPHKTKRACASSFFSSHKNDSVFRSHRMILICNFLLIRSNHMMILLHLFSELWCSLFFFFFFFFGFYSEKYRTN